MTTKQQEVHDDENYVSLLDHGFVGLVDHMGDDSSIVQAARVSYGKGTKSVSQDRGLIRFLLRHKHTTPFEMVEFKFHCKMPIFVARQWCRHRTANINEYSGRYSVMSNEFYVPELDVIQPQSKLNKQGRDGELCLEDKKNVQKEITKANRNAYDSYMRLLGDNGPTLQTSDLFEGISREMARGVLNVNNYTEWYWKIDLHNLFHFLKLRMDSHAQYEIRVFAQAMYELIKPLVPIAAEAFEDYEYNSVNLSQMEYEILNQLIDKKRWKKLSKNEDKLIENHGLSKRELKEFKEKFGLE